MTQEEFIKELDEKGCSYEIEGDKIVVTVGSGPTWRSTGNPTVYLNEVTRIPPNVVFRNKEDVLLNSLKILPPGIVFNNKGSVFIPSLTDLHGGTVFNNGDTLYFNSLKIIRSDVEFNNEGDVQLKSIISGAQGTYAFSGNGWFGKWEGNIGGIDSKRLLNKMISIGLFDRK